jgi:hypothetical protein
MIQIRHETRIVTSSHDATRIVSAMFYTRKTVNVDINILSLEADLREESHSISLA